MIYEVGDIAELKVTFMDLLTGNPADPTAVSLVIQSPDNVQTTVSGSSITHDLIGKYHYDLPITQAGRDAISPAYLYRWVATGAVATVAEGTLIVQPTILVPQPVASTEKPWTAADLNVLKTAVASGALSIRFQDRTVTYRSIDELWKAISIIEIELAETSGPPIIRQSRVFGAKGW